MSSDSRLAAYRPTGLSYNFRMIEAANCELTRYCIFTPIVASCQRNSHFKTLLAPSHPLIHSRQRRSTPDSSSPISSRSSTRPSSTHAGYTTSPWRETATAPTQAMPSAPTLTSPRNCSRSRTCAALAALCSCAATAQARALTLSWLCWSCLTACPWTKQSRG